MYKMRVNTLMGGYYIEDTDSNMICHVRSADYLTDTECKKSAEHITELLNMQIK